MNGRISGISVFVVIMNRPARDGVPGRPASTARRAGSAGYLRIRPLPVSEMSTSPAGSVTTASGRPSSAPVAGPPSPDDMNGQIPTSGRVWRPTGGPQGPGCAGRIVLPDRGAGTSDGQATGDLSRAGRGGGHEPRSREGPGRSRGPEPGPDQPDQGAVPGDRVHQGRRDRLLPADRAGAAAAYRRPATDPQAVPGRGDRPALLQQARTGAPARLGAHRAPARARLPLGPGLGAVRDRRRSPHPDLDDQPRRPGTAHPPVAAAPGGPARPARVRPRPRLARDLRRMLPRGAVPEPASARAAPRPGSPAP